MAIDSKRWSRAKTMSVQEIETAVAQLPPKELDLLMERLEEMRQEQWAEQIAQAKKDIAAGLGRPL